MYSLKNKDDVRYDIGLSVDSRTILNRAFKNLNKLRPKGARRLTPDSLLWQCLGCKWVSAKKMAPDSFLD